MFHAKILVLASAASVLLVASPAEALHYDVTSFPGAMCKQVGPLGEIAYDEYGGVLNASPNEELRVVCPVPIHSIDFTANELRVYFTAHNGSKGTFDCDFFWTQGEHSGGHPGGQSLRPFSFATNYMMTATQPTAYLANGSRSQLYSISCTLPRALVRPLLPTYYSRISGYSVTQRSYAVQDFDQ